LIKLRRFALIHLLVTFHPDLPAAPSTGTAHVVTRQPARPFPTARAVAGRSRRYDMTRRIRAERRLGRFPGAAAGRSKGRGLTAATQATGARGARRGSLSLVTGEDLRWAPRIGSRFPGSVVASSGSIGLGGCAGFSTPF